MYSVSRKDFPPFSLIWGLISLTVINGIDYYVDDHKGQMTTLKMVLVVMVGCIGEYMSTVPGPEQVLVSVHSEPTMFVLGVQLLLTVAE